MNRPFRPVEGKRHGPEYYFRQVERFGAKGFTVVELHAKCRSVSLKTVQQYVYTLRDCGAVERIGTAVGRTGKVAIRYAVAKRVRTAPVRRRPGPAGQRGLIQENLWQAMRRLSAFLIAELAYAASTRALVVSEDTAGLYVRRLVKADLVAVLAPPALSQPGVSGASAGVYALRPSANKGPAPLKIIANRVFDPNIRKFVGGAIDGSEVSA